MYILSDMLVLMLLTKFMWEMVSAGFMPWPLFVISSVGLPFLLGMGGRSGNRVLRGGVSVAGLAIFLYTLIMNRLHVVYMAMLIIILGLYFYGSMARVTLKSLLTAIIVILVIIIIMVSGKFAGF